MRWRPSVSSADHRQLQHFSLALASSRQLKSLRQCVFLPSFALLEWLCFPSFCWMVLARFQPCRCSRRVRGVKCCVAVLTAAWLHPSLTATHLRKFLRVWVSVTNQRCCPRCQWYRHDTHDTQSPLASSRPVLHWRNQPLTSVRPIRDVHLAEFRFLLLGAPCNKKDWIRRCPVFQEHVLSHNFLAEPSHATFDTNGLAEKNTTSCDLPLRSQRNCSIRRTLLLSRQPVEAFSTNPTRECKSQ